MKIDGYNRMIARHIDAKEIGKKSVRIGGPVGRFRKINNIWSPISYMGLTIITPPMEDENNDGNRRTYEKLVQIQQDIIDKLGNEKLAPVPPASFHMTLADLVSGDNYDTHVHPHERKFIDELSRVFGYLSLEDKKIDMEIAGLSMFDMGVVIAVLKALESDGFDRWRFFRDAIYSDPELKNTYKVSGFEPYTGHITMFYVEDVLFRYERDRLGDILNIINENIKEEGDVDFKLSVEKGEVRYFENMGSFKRKPNYPVYNF